MVRRALAEVCTVPVLLVYNEVRRKVHSKSTEKNYMAVLCGMPTIRSESPSGYRDCFRIRHSWEIQKVINGHNGSGKTCVGRGMHCPSAVGL